MNSIDLYNRDYLIGVIKHRINKINRAIRNDIKYYNSYTKIAREGKYKELYTNEANIMLDAINKLNDEKDNLMRELKDRLDYSCEI